MRKHNTTSKETKVSVLMPAYNAEKYIAESIESILNQTFKDFEFIIVNDASTDNTLKVIEKYAKKDKRIKVLNNKKNLNIAESLNNGIKHAKTNLIIRMDADDIANQNRLQTLYWYHKQYPNLAVIGSFIELIDEMGETIGTRKYPKLLRVHDNTIFKYSPFAHPSTMIIKNILIENELYDKTKSPSEDLDLWIKIGTKYKMGNIEQPLLKYRVYKNSASNKKLKQTEINTIMMRINAIKHHGYKPSIYDILYNIGQFLTLWIMPAKFRIGLFNLIRKFI